MDDLLNYFTPDEIIQFYLRGAFSDVEKLKVAFEILSRKLLDNYVITNHLAFVEMRRDFFGVVLKECDQTYTKEETEDALNFLYPDDIVELYLRGTFVSTEKVWVAMRVISEKLREGYLITNYEAYKRMEKAFFEEMQHRERAIKNGCSTTSSTEDGEGLAADSNREEEESLTPRSTIGEIVQKGGGQGENDNSGTPSNPPTVVDSEVELESSLAEVDSDGELENSHSEVDSEVDMEKSNNVNGGDGDSTTTSVVIPSPSNVDEEEAAEPSAVRFIADGELNLPRFRFGRRRSIFTMNPIPANTSPEEWLRKGVDEVLHHLRQGLNENNKVGLSIFDEDKPEQRVFIPWMNIDQLDSEIVLSKIENVLQSNKELLGGDRIMITLDYAETRRGYGNTRKRVQKRAMKVEDWVRCKKSIICINNKDTLCLARALVVAIAHANKNDEPKWGSIRQGREVQRTKAIELCTSAGVDLSNGGGLEEVREFQRYLLNDYQIVIYDGDSNETKCLFEGTRSLTCKKTLNLLLNDNHYNVITSLTGFLSCKYVCSNCNRRFNGEKASFSNHVCKSACPACHESPRCDSSLPIKNCNACDRYFYGDTCFLNHLAKNQNKSSSDSLCDRLKRCPKCLITVFEKNRKDHKCWESYCRICCEKKVQGHQCFIKKIKTKSTKKAENILFVFYDFECRQEKTLNGIPNSFEHEPNLCVLQQICNICEQNANVQEKCISCGERERIFLTDPVAELIDYLRQPRLQKLYKNIICIAHNSKGYDGHFILKYFVENMKCSPELIMNGNHILSMRIPNTSMVFIDSLAYLPMPLSNLPKTFGFSEEVKKGYFPHFFNTIENKDYVGEIPDESFYGVDEMSVDERKKFLVWYEEEKAKGDFDFMENLIEYCRNDVNILRRGCIEFRALFLQETSVDPFLDACTIAGACNKVFRKKHLKEKTIPVIPKGGYRWGDKQSLAAVQWLVHEEKERGIIIEHAGRGREKTVCGVKVDGYWEGNDEKIIFQYHGCYWHGHECIMTSNTALNHDPNDTAEARRERTQKITERLRQEGYKVVEMWECKFKHLKETHPEVEAYIENNPHTIKETINPRDAFFGGRTNATKLYHKTRGNEEIKYFDVCSLYPYVCKYGKYPVGHPIAIHVQNHPEIETFEGIMRCTVLPPQNLFHPVLPMRLEKKLFFTLCRSCAEGKKQEDCTHTEEERSIVGTWVADEIRLAVSKGYVIKKIHESWEYEVIQYDTKSKTGGHFSGYINSFLKMKQEASGWPVECTTEEAKKEYIDKYFAKEGILLEEGKIQKNAGRRALAKLMLNSFWGKFGQRENLPKTSAVHEPNIFHSIITDPSIIVNSVIPVNEDSMYVNWELVEEASNPLPTVNVVIAAYTTANARIELFKYLDKLDRRVLYYDTDSVIFLHTPDEWLPPTGNFLGDLTDELAEYGVGSYIIEFVSGGPKNYAYRVAVKGDPNNVKIVCKVKGITLNFSTEQSVNFDKLKEMIVDKTDEVVSVTYPKKIFRTKEHEIFSRKQNKKYRVVYEKRRRVDDYATLPFGYKKVKL